MQLVFTGGNSDCSNKGLSESIGLLSSLNKAVDDFRWPSLFIEHFGK